MQFFEKLIIIALGGLLFYAFLPVWQIAVCYMLCCSLVLYNLPTLTDEEEENEQNN